MGFLVSNRAARMRAGAAGLVTLLVLAALVLAGCGDEQERPGGSAAPGAVGAASLSDDSSPEEVKAALLDVLATLGPVRVEAVETREMGGEADLTTKVVQFLDAENRLGSETTTRVMARSGTESALGREEVSAVGLETVMLRTGEETEPQVYRWVRLRERAGSPLPVYGLPPDLLERSRAFEAHALDDGGWELLLEPQMDAVEAATVIERPASLRLVLSTDLLPLMLEQTTESTVGEGSASIGPDGETVTSETQRTERSMVRIEYQISAIEPLRPEDVELDVPPTAQVVQTLTELPLDDPQAGGDWPQYWLGEEVAELRLRGASEVENRGQDGVLHRQTMLNYGRPSDSIKLMLANRLRAAGEEDDWDSLTAPAQPGDATTTGQVAGRDATIHTRLIEEPLPAFLVRVVFPDAYVELTGYGLETTLVEELLEKLEEL